MAGKLLSPTSSVSTPADPPVDFAPVTPSDTADLPFTARALSWTVDGDIHVTTLAGVERTLPSGSLTSGDLYQGE